MTVLDYQAPPKRALITPARGLGVGAAMVALTAGVSFLLSHRPGWRPFMNDVWPFIVLAVSVSLVVLLISVAKLHAFLALVLAAISAGLMSAVGPLGGYNVNHGVAAVELTAAGFGQTAGGIGIVIALAAVIGMALLESGAADTIVRRFLDAFGPRRAGLALLLATYVVSIPIFFDTVFMLLVPLAVALWRNTGKDYILFVTAICCAGTITHTVVIPHPGPAAAAASLKVDAGMSILVGLVTGLVPLACGWAWCRQANRRMAVAPAAPTALPGAGGEGPAVPAAAGREATTAGETPAGREAAEGPSLAGSLLPIVLPLAMIWLASVAAMLGPRCPPAVKDVADFLGNKNVALFVGAGLAVAVLMRQRGLSLGQVAERLGPAMETAGIIILITSAGGAFGAMLRNAGIGEAIKNAAAGQHVNVIWLAYAVAVVMRCAQGSVTVAMITTAAIMAPMTGPHLPFHPMYVFLAVGYGSIGVSWMNDSGFWVISRLGGLTERQTLGSWTILTGVLSVSGVVTTYLLSVVLPFARR